MILTRSSIIIGVWFIYRNGEAAKKSLQSLRAFSYKSSISSCFVSRSGDTGCADGHFVFFSQILFDVAEISNLEFKSKTKSQISLIRTLLTLYSLSYVFLIFDLT